ncbi:hypothetical protein SAMN05421578_1495 [Paenibacillus macquariensis]|uniref:Uncharacterized protein n=1 Tax=Paenibacillus macquariensis TaxID=948756 RepID=A0ABY1KEV7_9BACL|nr:hypothetical protein SAMN05421578_1495 [Paenibacillus macquariensis]
MMSVHEVDKRKARRLKRRAATKERNSPPFCPRTEEIFIHNIFSKGISMPTTYCSV